MCQTSLARVHSPAQITVHCKCGDELLGTRVKDRLAAEEIHVARDRRDAAIKEVLLYAVMISTQFSKCRRRAMGFHISRSTQDDLAGNEKLDR